MNRRFIILFLIFSFLFAASCDKQKTAKNSNAAEIKRGVKPVADKEIAVIEMEQPAFGVIKIELYPNLAPKMVERFKELAREGVYNGTTFHRINDTVIQGGDPNSKDSDPTNDGKGGSGKPDVPAEFSDIPFDTGIVGAARNAMSNDSANSQFFIMLRPEPQFDSRYTVFGKVIEGMSNVRTIAGVNPKEGERPVEPVVIKSVTIKPM